CFATAQLSPLYSINLVDVEQNHEPVGPTGADSAVTCGSFYGVYRRSRGVAAAVEVGLSAIWRCPNCRATRPVVPICRACSLHSAGLSGLALVPPACDVERTQSADSDVSLHWGCSHCPGNAHCDAFRFSARRTALVLSGCV